MTAHGSSKKTRFPGLAHLRWRTQPRRQRMELSPHSDVDNWLSVQPSPGRWILRLALSIALHPRTELKTIGIPCLLANSKLSSRRYIVPSSCICRSAKQNVSFAGPKKWKVQHQSSKLSVKQSRFEDPTNSARMPTGVMPARRQKSKVDSVCPEPTSWQATSCLQAVLRSNLLPNGMICLAVQGLHQSVHIVGKDGPAWRSPIICQNRSALKKCFVNSARP